MGAFIDSYCERIEPGLWDEPLNAVTNLAFFIAAFFAWRLGRRVGGVTISAWVLIFFLIAIGIGSGLFHTMATRWASIADTAPITLYQVAFLWVHTRSVLRMHRLASVGLVILFFAVGYGFAIVPDPFNGSLSYAPALLFLLGLAIFHRRKAEIEPAGLFWAAGVFLVSLTFRSIDNAVCEAIPIGTHFIWHTLNGVVLYLTTRAFMLNRR